MHEWAYRSKKYMVTTTDTHLICEDAIQYGVFTLIPCDGCTEEEFRHIVHANIVVLTTTMNTIHIPPEKIESDRNEVLSYLYEHESDSYILQLLGSAEWRNQMGLNPKDIDREVYSQIMDTKYKAKEVDNIEMLRVKS